MIDNLSSIHAMRVAEEAANPTSRYNMSEPKHIFILKTLYGMVDEMLSKNFLEDKRTNQKNLFEKDPNENSKIHDHQTLNYEELITNLKEQLDQFDFIAEHERAQEENEAYEEYYLEDYDGGITP